MFFHEFIYELKNVIRTKEEIFWVLAFPMILGTMFFFAFGSINETTENYHTIPVAACIEENGNAAESFQTVLDTLSDEEEAFLSVVYTDKENALSLLEENTIRGIFTVSDDVTLTCAPSGNNANSTLAIEQSILEIFLREYRTNAATITEIAMNNPQKLPDLISLMETEADYKKVLSLTDGNMDNMVQYYYNLLAMACLYTSFAGCFLAIKNQANRSALGARKTVAPHGKFVSVIAQLFACLLSQYACIAVNVLFLVYIIKVDFRISLPMLLFTSLIACIVGVCFGYMVGGFGKMKETTKTGIMIGTVMVCCFLSGLMVQNMRGIIENFCPIINDINPAAIIADSFYTLNIYGVGERYTHNIISLLIIAGIFTAIGSLTMRRKTYASL